MKPKLTALIVFMVMLALAAGQPVMAAPPAQDPDLPPAPITNDEGGPKRLVGRFDYASFSFLVVTKDPSLVLLDMVNIIEEGPSPTQFAPVESQILGYLTSPLSPSPATYAFNLPAEPIATLLDVDNDGQDDTGVQIFRLNLAANINGDSYLQQLDQNGPASYLIDPRTGQMTEGSLLVYAPDDQQGFPGGFGPDGLLFTEDDPAVGLPQGYTVVHFGPDGFTFDRSAEAEMDLLEPPEGASPDYSDQGIVESFNSLIDHLAERYAFTELRELDWEAIRAEYLPQVEEAEQTAADDPDLGSAKYASALYHLAQSIRDAHVQAAIVDPAYSKAAELAKQLNTQPIAANVGANTVELSDGRIVVSDVITDSPAAEAGWTLGTEIVSVNGETVAERLPTVIYSHPTGTDEGQRLFQVNNLLKFPAPAEDDPAAEVTIEAILPGDTEAQSFTMTPGVYPLPDRTALHIPPMFISYRMIPTEESTVGYLTWLGFTRPIVTMAVLEDFLGALKTAPSVDGIILDLRGNGGGWAAEYFTMASYFFNADNPVSMYWLEQDSYDAAEGDLVRGPQPKYLLSAPQPDLYYDGPIVILVDQNCGSSCEFFPQFLQTTGRATVVGQTSTAGAGGPINQVHMPSGITFQYTQGRFFFAGTDELNLEGKGVVPDVRVPVTLESVEAVMQGQDPVLEAGLEELKKLAGQ